MRSEVAYKSLYLNCVSYSVAFKSSHVKFIVAKQDGYFHALILNMCYE